MKAKYIIEAIEAMKAAERQLNSYPDDRNTHQRESWKVNDQVAKARIHLQVYSGVLDVPIEVEAE